MLMMTMSMTPMTVVDIESGASKQTYDTCALPMAASRILQQFLTSNKFFRRNGYFQVKAQLKKRFTNYRCLFQGLHSWKTLL